MRAMRVVGIVVLLSMLAAVAPFPARAGGLIEVYLNGQPLALDVAPRIVDGRTLVPMRAIFEALGATVTWHDATRTVAAAWEGGSLVMQVGAAEATVSGQIRRLDVPAQIFDGRTLVPLRFVAESLGALVGWYPASETITINRPEVPLLAGTVTAMTAIDRMTVQLASGDIADVLVPGIKLPYGHQLTDALRQRLVGQPVLLEPVAAPNGPLQAYVHLPGGVMWGALLIDEAVARAGGDHGDERYGQLNLAVDQKVWRASGKDAEQVRVTVAGKGEISFRKPKFFADSTLWLPAATALKATGSPQDGAAVRELPGGLLQVAPGYTIDAGRGVMLMRAGEEPLQPPLPRVADGAVYLPVETIASMQGCTVASRSGGPGDMTVYEFTCPERGLPQATQARPWDGEPALVTRIWLNPDGTLEADPDYYPWAMGGQVVEMELDLTSLPTEEATLRAAMTYDMIFYPVQRLKTWWRVNGQDRAEAVVGHEGATVTLAVKRGDRVTVRMTSESGMSRPQPPVSFHFELVR